MSISVNGQSQVPPGFRFHPTEEELLHYYLRKKISSEKIDFDVIRDVDLNKMEPWDIQEKCKLGTTPQCDYCYFFNYKDKKYPTGTRTNRATAAGFWKATGRDKMIYGNCRRRIGMRKTLVFYKGRAPHGQKSDWIMYEYRLDYPNPNNVSNVVTEEAMLEESWVVCRIFKKKDHHHKTLDCPTSSYANREMMMMRNRIMLHSSKEGSLDQILQQMSGTNYNEESHEANNNLLGFFGPKDSTTDIGGFQNGCSDSFLKLPSLESPNSIDNEGSGSNQVSSSSLNNSVYQTEQQLSGLTSWATLDRLVASQLNGQTQAAEQFACFNDPTMAYGNPTDTEDDNYGFQSPSLRAPSICSTRSYHGPDNDYNSGIDLWSFTRSSSSFSTTEPLCQVSKNSV